MQAIQNILRFKESAVMHLVFGLPLRQPPASLWVFVLWHIAVLLLPIFYPATQETLDFLVRCEMFTVNALLLVFVSVFVMRLITVLYLRDKEQREQIKNQYMLQEVASLAHIMLPDVLVYQYRGESIDDFSKRVQTARLNATKSYWVVVIPFRATYAVVYTGMSSDGNMIRRGELEWEKDLPADQKITAPGYDFTAENEERYLVYIEQFAKGWRKWAPEGKPMYFQSEPRDAVDVVINNAHVI